MRLAPVFSALMAAGLWLVPQTAQAFFSEVWSYLHQYQLGIDYTSSYDTVNASYETAKVGAIPAAGCDDLSGQPTRQICTVSMKGGGGSGYGIVLQQAFKRQGTFYFKPDVGFGVHYLTGRLDQSQSNQQVSEGLPLREMQFNLAAVVMKPELTVGVTPERLPDVLLSLGPAAQVALGRVEVNGQSKDVAVATSSNSLVFGFVQLEVVPLRFGNGCFSLFESTDVTGDGRGSKLYPNTVDGMSNVRGSFQNTVSGGFYNFGAKLVFNWP